MDKRKENLAEMAAMQSKIEAYQEEQIKITEKLAVAGQEYATNLQRITSEFMKADKERNLLRQEVAVLTTEVQAVRLQSTRSNEKMVQLLHEKDQELAGLRKRANAPQSGNDSLDNRIKSLTQSLIQKQTSLEVAIANGNALKRQLENVESQYRNLSLRDTADSVYRVHSMTDDDKAALPAFMQENPFDNQTAKRIKRAIKASDNLFRRYPLLRIFIFFYILLLHIWVMVVLMSSTPPTETTVHYPE